MQELITTIATSGIALESETVMALARFWFLSEMIRMGTVLFIVLSMLGLIAYLIYMLKK